MTKELDQANDTVPYDDYVDPEPTQAEIAKKRGWQTLAQSLGVDVAVGVALVLITFIGPLKDWGEVQWTVLGFTLAKSIVQAVAAWIIRRYRDKSGFAE